MVSSSNLSSNQDKNLISLKTKDSFKSDGRRVEPIDESHQKTAVNKKRENMIIEEFKSQRKAHVVNDQDVVLQDYSLNDFNPD